MAHEKLCPKCGEDITDSRCDDDPDVGIHGGCGYYCDACNEGYPLEDYNDEFDWERET